MFSPKGVQMCGKTMTVSLAKVREFIKTETAPASPERAAMLKLSHLMFTRPEGDYDPTRFEDAVHAVEVEAGIQQLLTGAV
jgi:hypothetical protein